MSLTTKLPFEDDEFDHVHIQAIAKGVPENKWGVLFEEVNRVLRPGGSVEIIEDDVIFPVLPRWFTTALRSRARRDTSAHNLNALRSYPSPPSTPSQRILAHDHALLESLNKSVFEHRFINTKPTAVLPSYFTTYFRQVTLGPVISFPMPPIPPPQPLPPPMANAYSIGLDTDTLDSRTSTIPISINRPTSLSFSSTISASTTLTYNSSNRSVFSGVTNFPTSPIPPPRSLPPTSANSYSIGLSQDTIKSQAPPIIPFPINRPTSLSFSSTTSASTTLTRDSNNPSVFSMGPRTTSASFSSTYETPDTSGTFESGQSNREPFERFLLDGSLSESEIAALPRSLFPVEQLQSLSERSLAMHLYRSYQSILACQEAMWEELNDRILNRREELTPFGWDDDEDLEELKNRKKFERLVERYRRLVVHAIVLIRMLISTSSDMQTRVALWCSLTEIGWLFPPREALSKAELIEEERIRDNLLEARRFVSEDDKEAPCRSVRIHNKMAASTSRQPYQVPLPPSPPIPVKSGKKQTSRKGKGKENAAQTPQATGDISWDTLESETDWDWSYLTDPCASKVPPIFTKDGNYFFSLVGSSVKIHSVTTGQVVSTLSAPRSTSNGTSSDLLTAAILNPHNSFQLITGSLDGRLVVWDFVEAVLLWTIDISQPIHHICAHETWKDTVFVAASRPSKKTKTPGTDENAVVLRVSLQPVENTSKSTEILPIGKTRYPTGLTLSPSGTWLIATAGHKAYVAATSSLTSGFTKYVSPERLTCLSFHPTEEYFATGDDKGNVRLWYCLNEPTLVNARGVEKKTQTTTLHWHAHAVSSIAFTSNGAYLLSGGEESVLVIWQLHTGKKEFVPRVGAPINTVSVSKNGRGDEEYLLGLADATYLFVSSGNMKISRSYSRIKLGAHPALSPESTSRHTRTPLAFHSLSATLILPSSHPSSLQLFSPSSSRLISELEVSPSNKVSRRDDKPLEPSYVEQVDISLSGEWLATIDIRQADDGFRDEIYLKLWRWDMKNSRWILNTRVDYPHGFHKVTCISFSPASKDLLVTTGEDGAVKTWGVRSIKRKSGAVEEFWVARSTFNFRSEVPASASWSQDASLMAVVFGPYVALYDPTTNILCQTLVSPEGKPSRSAHFIGKEGRYLAVVEMHGVTLWDLLSQSVRWSYKALLSINKVVSHPETDSFAVFHTSPNQELKKTRVLVFCAASPTPRIAHCLPLKLRSIAPYHLTRSSGHTFVGITDDWSVVVLGDNAKQGAQEGSTATGIALNSVAQKRTLFQDIFGKSAFTTTAGSSILIDESQYGRPGKATTNTFDAPAYLMPTFEHFFDHLISGFLRPQVNDIPMLTQVVHDEDVDMDEEPAEPALVGGHNTRVVGQDEMDSFVTLFRNHSVKCSTTLPANGHSSKSKISNAPHPLDSASPSPPVGAKQRVLPQRTPVARTEVDVTASSTVALANCRKRKKSLG
ncbi:hypothetical protein DXG01_009942 [Tephrocybe rancida]|nr:hypothetical protein DXG01_009942 [Tephrocybe rancida]